MKNRLVSTCVACISFVVAQHSIGAQTIDWKAIGDEAIKLLQEYVRIDTSTRLRPRRSISGRCVSLKASAPVSSLYSLSNVPPVTKMLMGSGFIGRFRRRATVRG